MKNSTFYGKILLFGEYSLLYNSKALSIPYTNSSGKLSFIGKHKNIDVVNALKSNSIIKEFATYLQYIISEDDDLKFDINQLNTDLSNGLFFDSNIKQEYGIGSSGALIAALYQKYSKNTILPELNIHKQSINSLISVFAKMEALFHGKSSGFDPLNSYLKKTLLINSPQDIKIINDNSFLDNITYSMFLFDSKTIAQTSPLINWFMKNMQDYEFANLINSFYNPKVNSIIDDLISGNNKHYFDIKQLSEFQLKHFSPLIPETIVEAWENGIQNDNYYLKLCGAGGGGYFLGFTNDYNNTKLRLKNMNFDIIPINKSNNLLWNHLKPSRGTS